jgi:hypothetical protein
MNKRIKQLAEQAGIVIPKDSEYNGHIYRNTIEKFAQLIVQDCASLFPHTFTDEQYQRRIDKTIKKHFGVDDGTPTP